MNWKFLISLLVATVAIFWFLRTYGMQFWIAYFIALTFMFFSVMYSMSKTRKRLSKILEEHVNPKQYLEIMTKQRKLSNKPRFQASCDVAEAEAFYEYGDFQTAKMLLERADTAKLKKNKQLLISRHLSMIIVYCELGQMKEAKNIYNTHIKSAFDKLFGSLRYRAEWIIAEYKYDLKKSPVAAKAFMDSMEEMLSFPDKILTKRTKMHCYFNLGKMQLIYGNGDEGRKNLSIVAKQGGTLFICTEAKRLLGELSEEDAERVVAVPVIEDGDNDEIIEEVLEKADEIVIENPEDLKDNEKQDKDN